MKTPILRTSRGTLVAATLLDGLFSLSRTACIVFALCAATAIIAPAQSEFHTLFSFQGSNGANPGFGNLVQGPDGKLYGTTQVSTGTQGTVFKFAYTAKKPTTLHVFCTQGSPCSDGAKPLGGLTLASNGMFYGTTEYGGGASNDGSVFQITSTGKLTPVFDFDGSETGSEPQAAPFQAKDGNLYGTTSIGGSSNLGTLYEMTTSAGGDEVSISFTGGNGELPYARLMQGTNQNIYGTTAEVTSGNGTIFAILPKTGFARLHTFQGVTNGGHPIGGLVQASNLYYGTTSTGGGHSQGGTVFSMTPAGKVKTIYSFCAKPNCTDGRSPLATLVLGTDGNLYGTTYNGGANETSCNSGCGTIFQITPAGTLMTLYNFCGLANCADGYEPQGGLVQATNGTFYGTTEYGGPSDAGTVFSLSLEGLKPFVKIIPAWGTAGATAMILGDKLTDATKVTVGGVSAAFRVVSSTEIEVTVPTGASPGTVTVDTPGGTLKSNVIFQVD